MPRIWFGGKDERPVELAQSNEFVVVRKNRARKSVTAPSATAVAAQSVTSGAPVLSFPEAEVDVFRVAQPDEEGVGRAKSVMAELAETRFAGRALVDPGSGEPVVYTENLFVKFADGSDDANNRAVLAEHGLAVKHKVDYAESAYFVGAPEGTGQEVFEIAERLLARDDVEYCHPEVVRRRSHKRIFSQQWHLADTTVNGTAIRAHANVAAAHSLSTGENVTIAVIDDGVDIDHPEFGGAGKIVHPFDASQKTSDPRPKRLNENHGTACAGVACANGTKGASGVAPDARLMPIRLSSAMGSQDEADAFAWAARKGADIISCSWGPPDGKWWDPADPGHSASWPIPASTRLAIDFAVDRGRNGKGCVIFFAAGNGNERVENDGYASYPKVIAVAACNDRGKRSYYSDFGAAIWCAFPSDDVIFDGHPAPLTSGIWTTDRLGRQGYNTGSNDGGDAEGMFTNSFGGTSSACPGAAGVAALILARNPALSWAEVRDLIAAHCDKIDPIGGHYNANGRSEKYGYGRINAAASVGAA